MALRDFALLMLVCLMWGLNTIVSKLVVTDLNVPPLFYAACRFAVVMAFVFPWLRSPPRPVWPIALSGFLVAGGTFGFMFIGLTTASPSSAAIVSQLGMPMTVGLSVVMLGEQLTRRRVAGMALSLIGVLAVMWDPHGLVISRGLLWIALGAFAGALGAVLMKQVKEGVRPIQFQAWAALASVLPMALGSLLFEHGQIQAMVQAGWRFWAAVVFAAIVVSLFAHTVFYGLLRRYEANLISPLTLMGPVLTILLGVVITRDHFDLRMAGGALAALTGVLIIGINPSTFAAALSSIRSRRP